MLFFVGSGGGRFAMITQTRRTGGFRLETEEVSIHFDPGPGALLATRLAGRPTTAVDAVVVSHAHPDHYTEAEVVVEAMTRGGIKNRGYFIGSASAVEGYEGEEGSFGPVLSNYHRSLPEATVALEPGDRFTVGDVTLEATPTVHGDPTGVGFRVELEDDLLYYTSDTELRGFVIDAAEDATILVANVTRPGSDRIRGHLCTSDLVEVVKEARDLRKVFMTHFGMKIIKRGPGREANSVQKRTGVTTVAARDGQVYDL